MEDTKDEFYFRIFLCAYFGNVKLKLIRGFSDIKKLEFIPVKAPDWCPLIKK
jgi:hypothetical protein